MDIEFNLLGVEEMEALFKALPQAMQKNVLTSAVRKGSRIIQKAAKRNLQVSGTIRTGLLHHSINFKIKVYKSGIVYAAIGARRDVVGTTPEGKRIRPANYIHLVEGEFGTRHIRARPFLRPALDNNRTNVFNTMIREARRGMTRNIKKLRKATSGR